MSEHDLPAENTAAIEESLKSLLDKVPNHLNVLSNSKRCWITSKNSSKQTMIYKN